MKNFRDQFPFDCVYVQMQITIPSYCCFISKHTLNTWFNGANYDNTHVQWWFLNENELKLGIVTEYFETQMFSCWNNMAHASEHVHNVSDITSFMCCD